MNIIESIKQSGCLKPEDFNFLKSKASILQKTWNKRQVFRTRTEMEVSVLNDIKHPTKASKYWQAVREQSHFYELVISDSFAYRRNSIKIEQKIKSIKMETDNLQKELLKIDLEEMYFKKASMEQVLAWRIDELKQWDDIINNLDDGSFDTMDVNAHQLHSYSKVAQNKMRMLDGVTDSAEKANIVGLYATTNRVVKTGVNKIEKALCDGKKVHSDK